MSAGVDDALAQQQFRDPMPCGHQIAAAVLATLGAAPVRADDRIVARLVSVSGNVLVSNDSSIASAGEALRLVSGMRVIATANSSATVEYANGCRVKVASGERLEVSREHACASRASPRADVYAAVEGKPS